MKALLIASFFCLAVIFNVSGQETPQEMLNKAIYEEEVNGNLEEAMKLYLEIVDENSTDRTVTAEAYYHLGLTNEKLGNKKAKEYYEKVVNNFEDQPEFVRISKERLKQLILIAEKVSNAPLIPKFTKIKIPSTPGNGLLSPDGKWCAFISEGSVWKIPISGEVDPYIAGEPQKLTNDIGAYDMNSTFAWSGDGEWIAFNADMKFSSTSIYVVPSKGGIPQKVQVPEHRCGFPEEFRLSLSPEGKLVAYATGKNSGNDESKLIRIYTIPVNGDTPTELTGPWTQEPSFSPDGSKIAFVKNYRRKEGRGWISDVWVIPYEGGTPIQVSNLKSGQVRGPIWSADGKMIAFHRRPEGGNPKEIWIVPVSEDGSPTKTPKKIDLPLETFHEVAGWTPDNKIGLQLMNPPHEIIYTVPSSGGIATQVTPQGWTSYPKWSPNGEKIFFRWGSGKIACVPSGGGKVDSIPIQSEFNIFSALPGSGNDISPDGKTIVFAGAKYNDKKKRHEVDIYTIPITGGKPNRITSGEGRFPCWSPDGNSIAYIGTQIKDNKIIHQISIVTKEGGNLKRITNELDKLSYAPIDWNPDGKSITYFAEDKTIKSIPIDGGDTHDITKIHEINDQFELAWSPDGKELAYTDNGKIWIFSKESETTKEIKTGVKAMATKLSWSPDGAKIAFTAFGGGDQELWVMEDFLPLEKLAQKNTVAELAPKTTTLQKIELENVYFGADAVSPDGKFLTYSGEKDNMAICELSTGKTHLLTSEATWDDPMQIYSGSTISPNSKQIAYGWYKNNYEIRIIDVENPLPKTIYANTGEDVYPCTWSPDGKTIYAKSYLRKTRQCRILAISVENGDVQILKTFDFFYWLQLSVSPDNKFVAYHFPNIKNGENSDTDIHLVSTDGEKSMKLIEHPANDQVIGWFPGKNQLLFKSDRGGSWAIWTAELVDGEVVGNPKKVLAEIGGTATPMGITNSGSFYYSQIYRKFDAFTVPFNQTNGEVKSEFEKPLLGSVRNAEWSPDGKSLALIKELWTQNKRPLYVRDAETGNERMLSDNFIIRHLLWLQDNKTLLILGNDARRESEKTYSGGMYTINAQTSEITEVLAFSDYRGKDWEIGLTVAQMLAKGNTAQKNIYFLKNGQLICRELASGEEKILLKDPSLNSNDYTLGPLPGEKNILYCNENQIYIIPVSGGKQIPIMKRTTTDSGPTVPNSAVWSSDGNYIYYTQNINGGSNLWRISAEGENPIKVWQSKVPISSISIHPNGQTIAITTLDQGSEIWKVDNLLLKP